MEFRKVIGPTETIPTWYGIAYLRHDKLAAICYPIPINLIVGSWCKLFDHMKTIYGYSSFADLINEMYHRGYQHGQQEERNAHIRN